jgi:redox-sensitive bicupin YhaK (pirin superfamily)
MAEPSYQEVGEAYIPEETRGDSCHLKVVAGRTSKGTEGAISNDLVDPIYWDINLASGAQFSDVIPEGHNAFIYVIEGELRVADSKVNSKQLAILSNSDNQNSVEIEATSLSRFLLIAGKPLNEPVARGGPFVMNTREEIQQAFADYESGQLA